MNINSAVNIYEDFINVILNSILFSTRLCGKLILLNRLTGVWALFDSKLKSLGYLVQKRLIDE